MMRIPCNRNRLRKKRKGKSWKKKTPHNHILGAWNEDSLQYENPMNQKIQIGQTKSDPTKNENHVARGLRKHEATTR
jgi:hypothetical protein